MFSAIAPCAPLNVNVGHQGEGMHVLDRNASVLGRLLEELSWRGETIRRYRNGGRGYENVLTAEALQGLDFLPRTTFLGAVLAAAHGAPAALRRLVSEVEEAKVTLLPGNQYLIPSGTRHQTRLPVQPDGLIETPNCFVVVEAKGLGRSSFQPEQLSREYVLTLRDAGARAPIFLLVLPTEPPVKIKDHGKLVPEDAIELYLEPVLARAEQHSISPAQARKLIPEVVCWTTWSDIARIVEQQRTTTMPTDKTVSACIDRLAFSVTRAIAWHAIAPNGTRTDAQPRLAADAPKAARR